ncbi:MAG TPA: hypothetical protein EYP67_01860 [Methanosarcinales archaeon]|nr:hypothetical protein [Methanosarcinales archaeon]
MSKESVKIPTGIDAVLAGSQVRSKHVLLLYTSCVNKYAIQASFFAASEGDEKLVYVTCEEPDLIRSKFERSTPGLSVVHPDDIDDLRTADCRMRIITDSVFRHEILDEFLAESKDHIALCMYDLSMLESERLEELAASHDRIILNTPDMAVLSGGSLEELDVAGGTVERFVKEYLDIVVLALIASKPLCGTDIMDMVHRDFNVLLSPGTIYPLLHRLRKEGLLECEYGVKKKIYKPAKGSEASIRSILDEHLLANEFINGLLKSRELEAKTA